MGGALCCSRYAAMKTQGRFNALPDRHRTPLAAVPRSRHNPVALLGVLAHCLAALLLAPASATAAVRDYTIRWIPSPTGDVVGYRLSIGTSPGTYDVALDLGVPSVVGGEMKSTVQLEDGLDQYLTLQAVGSGNVLSPLSNEIVVAAGQIIPGLPGGTTGLEVFSVTGLSPVVSGEVQIVANADPEIASVIFYLDGTYHSSDYAPPFSLAGDMGWAQIHPWNSSLFADGEHTLYALGFDATGARVRSLSVDFLVDNVEDPTGPRIVGVTTSAIAADPGSAQIELVDENGITTPLLVDPRGAAGDIRPAWCDLNGDDEQDLVLGFGPGGEGSRRPDPDRGRRRQAHRRGQPHERDRSTRRAPHDHLRGVQRGDDSGLRRPRR